MTLRARAPLGGLLGATLLIAVASQALERAPMSASTTLPAASAPTTLPSASAAPAPGSLRPAASITRYRYELVSERPHDPGAWTQGLVLDASGRLFESTGQYGETSLREVDPLTGRVLRSSSPEEHLYGEGLALIDDRLIQLTWTDGLALVWAVETFAPLGRFAYTGEGWGLCHDGSRLVMSDGSSRLTFRDPDTFLVVGAIDVTLDDAPIERLNELECVDGAVWANVWETDTIVEIDPTVGRVSGVLDAAGLLSPHPALSDRGAVLNGIARDARSNTWLLTGKRWPSLFEVRLIAD